MLYSILHCFIAFEASATQKFLQYPEQVKNHSGPSLDYMLDVGV